jgi:hypothetical protein
MDPTQIICFKCKHFNEFEGGCTAFDEIPEEILSGENDHSSPLPDQSNDIVFELAD